MMESLNDKSSDIDKLEAKLLQFMKPTTMLITSRYLMKT